MSSTLYKLRKQRFEKVKKLRRLGINPYPSRSNRSHNNREIIKNYSQYKGAKVTIVGRIMSFRTHGSIKFANIQDFSGKIQIILRKDILKNKFNVKKQTLGWMELGYLEIGDFIQIEGFVVKSKTDEISIDAENVKVLTKSIRPLPEKWEGIKDKEIKFRRRYLDLATNKKSKDLFTRKSKFWRINREFMNKNGFIELNTPILEHVTGGADANPFKTHHDTLDQDFYMRISPELYLKRLIGGGFEKVYTIGACFRNEGIDEEHLQEYYTNEWYWAYADYRKNMKLVMELYRYIAKEVYNKTKFKKGHYEFDLADEWKEVDYIKKIKEKFGVDVFTSSDEEMLKIIKDHKISLEEGSKNRYRLVDNIWKIIRKEIAGPVFIVNEPKFMSPLAKSKDSDAKITERFHVIIAGSELGNGYSELNDPIDQYERFEDQQKAREAGDSEAQMMDIDFVEMLEYGMPPTTGFGMTERLFWFLENVSAREGTLFPQTRYHLDETTKEIYGINGKKYGDDDSKKQYKKNEGKIGIEKAEKILQKYVKSTSLLNHSEMVAKAMKGFAKKFGEDEEKWYIAGLLHDFDYEKWPDKHPQIGKEILVKAGVPSDIIKAIQGHADYSGVPRETKMAKVLYAVDELCGLIHAVSLMRPNRMKDMKVKSVMKKFKVNNFAAKIDREQIKKASKELGVELSILIKDIIDILKD